MLADNAEFRAFGLNDYSESSILKAATTFVGNVDQSYGLFFYKKFWDTYDASDAQETEHEVQNIIDLYFPNGRPTD